MINLIIHVLKRFAWFKRFNAKITYELLAKHIPVADWHFMNYGYVPTEKEPALDLPNDPKIQKFSRQMYHYLAIKTQIEGKHVLEVGSGRGGGARHIASHLKPASYVGMDLAQSAVDLANKIHVLPNLKFIQGSAESIPLADNSIDVVVNVESSHAYGSVVKFLNEVKRVLKPGGYLLLVDFRNEENVEKMATLKEQLKNTGMALIEEENISDNVIRSIEEEDASKQERIRTLIPKKWQKLFAEFAGVVGSKFHLTLKNRTRLYYRFVLRKQV
jgi:ubiquinone/menaquinone biosynthesis C-methylase UbiE